MEKEKLSKKQIAALVIGVLTMIILVSSATYAYFKVSIGNTATSTTITGDIGGDTIGTVTLSGGGSELYLGVSAYDMSESKKGTTYYSSSTSGSRETNKNNAGKTTYTATLSGDETNEIMYACDYEFTVTSSGTALGKEHTSDISVVFEGDIKKTIPLSASETVSGTWFGFKKSNAERELNAYLQLSNTDNEQNDLAGTNISVEIKNTKWKCYLSEAKSADIGEAYALLTANKDDSNFYDLTFLRSETPIDAGDTYNGVEVIESYTGLEEEFYNSSPWITYGDAINVITFEDEIRPLSTAHWFEYTFATNVVDFTNLNMSLVTDASYMLSGASISNWNLSTLDVSNITNMSGMFANCEPGDLDLSMWNVSNVTDMSGMFQGYNAWSFDNYTLNLSNWNTRNVTDMSYMFESVSCESGEGSISLVGLSSWNVSKVTDMSYMFNCINLENDLDLTGWDVSKVTSYENFSRANEITPPVWKNLYFGVYSEDDYSLRIYNDLNIPIDGETYEGRIATKVYNISAKGSKPVRCNSTVVPTSIIAEDNLSPTNIAEWFCECTKVNTIDLSKVDTSNVTDMYRTFEAVGSDSTVTSMTIIGIDIWDTGNVTRMESMFYSFGKNAKYALDLSGWNVSSVTHYADFNTFVENKVIAPSWNS